MTQKMKIDFYGHFSLEQIKAVVDYLEDKDNIDFDLPLEFIVEKDLKDVIIAQSGSCLTSRIEL